MTDRERTLEDRCKAFHAENTKLRADLAAAQQERDEAIQREVEWKQSALNGEAIIDKLRADLAAAQQERDEALTKMTYTGVLLDEARKEAGKWRSDFDKSESALAEKAQELDTVQRILDDTERKLSEARNAIIIADTTTANLHRAISGLRALLTRCVPMLGYAWNWLEERTAHESPEMGECNAILAAIDAATEGQT